MVKITVKLRILLLHINKLSLYKPHVNEISVAVPTQDYTKLNGNYFVININGNPAFVSSVAKDTDAKILGFIYENKFYYVNKTNPNIFSPASHVVIGDNGKYWFGTTGIFIDDKNWLINFNIIMLKYELTKFMGII